MTIQNVMKKLSYADYVDLVDLTTSPPIAPYLTVYFKIFGSYLYGVITLWGTNKYNPNLNVLGAMRLNRLGSI